MRQTRTFPRGLAGAGRNAAGTRGQETRKTNMGVAVAIVVVGVLAAALWITATMPAASLSVQDGLSDLPPSTPVTVSVWNLGGSVLEARLTESIRDIDGNPAQAREIPVQMVPVSGSGLWSNYRIERSDGSPLLALDGVYQLTLTTKSALAGLLGAAASTHEYGFSALTSPRLRLPTGVVPLDYQKPLELHWNQPVQSFKVETSPAVAVQTRIDPSRGDVTYVDLTGAKPGTEYDVRVVAAVAASGAELVAPAQLRVLTPAPPEVVAGKVKIEEGYRVIIPWDRAIKAFDYEITPAVQSAANVGMADPWDGYILLMNPKQGQEYTVRIKSALATTGAPLSGTREVKVTTPKPLKVNKFLPEQPKWGVPLEKDNAISITFSEPVKDRAATEKAITITPAVKGKFEWTQPDRVQFVPQVTLPGATDFTVQIASGRDGVIGADGGYLDTESKFTFWTAPEKEIEVNLSAQNLTLWQGGEPVYTTLVSTGVRGAETPTGLFSVQYKMTATRMRGTNPSGHTYDLPDVPWVMSFLGDYTLHGAYWRDTYGVEQSNGCVSMPVSVAKKVYDWTPEGTPVRIHY